eukprot:2566272-Pyramimonas_sp.AAC.1
MSGPPPRTAFYNRVPGSWVLAWAVFRMLLLLQRWPHSLASAPSESCSRCSAGLISGLPLVPIWTPEMGTERI